MSDETRNEKRLEAELSKAWDLLEGGDVEGARGIAERLQAAVTDHPDVPLLLATCAREEGDDQKTMAYLREAARLDPTWAEPDLRMADVLAADPERLEEALRYATSAARKAEEEDEVLDALALKAGLELELDKVEAARQTLADLPPPEAADAPPLVAHEIGHLLLAVDEFDNAGKWLRRLVDRHPDFADGWHALGMAAEAQGDEAAKRKAWLRTLSLDAKEPEEEVGEALSESEVAEVAEEALAELPARARALLENVPILIADRPAEKDVAEGLDPRLLGLFSGTPHPEASAVGGVPQLTQILLFRKNLERVAEDDEHLREEIRTTLLHETGHFFGMDEDDLEKVGLN